MKYGLIGVHLQSIPSQKFIVGVSQIFQGDVGPRREILEDPSLNFPGECPKILARILREDLGKYHPGIEPDQRRSSWNQVGSYPKILTRFFCENTIVGSSQIREDLPGIKSDLTRKF